MMSKLHRLMLVEKLGEITRKYINKKGKHYGPDILKKLVSELNEFKNTLTNENQIEFFNKRIDGYRDAIYIFII